MAYEILEHTADAGVRGIGKTLEEAFAEAARGMFSLMADLSQVRPVRELPVGAMADDLGGLLVAFLGELLFLRDREGMLFSRFAVEIERESGGWKLKGKAVGEPLDPRRHRLGVEVKAATYAGVRVEKTERGYIAQCILDV